MSEIGENWIISRSQTLMQFLIVLITRFYGAIKLSSRKWYPLNVFLITNTFFRNWCVRRNSIGSKRYNFNCIIWLEMFWSQNVHNYCNSLPRLSLKLHCWHPFKWQKHFRQPESFSYGFWVSWLEVCWLQLHHFWGKLCSRVLVPAGTFQLLLLWLQYCPPGWACDEFRLLRWLTLLSDGSWKSRAGTALKVIRLQIRGEWCFCTFPCHSATLKQDASTAPQATVVFRGPVEWRGDGSLLCSQAEDTNSWTWTPGRSPRGQATRRPGRKSAGPLLQEVWPGRLLCLQLLQIASHILCGGGSGGRPASCQSGHLHQGGPRGLFSQ